MTNEKKEKKVIPVFFAADDKYVPFLAVTLQSIKEHASSDDEYRIYVLHAGVSDDGSDKIKKFESENWLCFPKNCTCAIIIRARRISAFSLR